MELIKTKTKTYGWSSEKYRFDCQPSTSADIKTGLLICWSFLQKHNLDIISLIFTADRTNNRSFAQNKKYTGKELFRTFPTFEAFLSEFYRNDFKYWQLNLMYEGIECSASGNSWKNVINFSYPTKYMVLMLLLLVEMENMVSSISLTCMDEVF